MICFFSSFSTFVYPFYAHEVLCCECIDCGSTAHMKLNKKKSRKAKSLFIECNEGGLSFIVFPYFYWDPNSNIFSANILTIFSKFTCVAICCLLLFFTSLLLVCFSCSFYVEFWVLYLGIAIHNFSKCRWKEIFFFEIFVTLNV